jgi:hypothetical protein
LFHASRVHQIAGKPVHCHKAYNHKEAKFLGECIACTHYGDFWKNGAPRCCKMGDVTHPVTGHDFFINRSLVRTPNGAQYPQYNGSQFMPATPLHKDREVMESWMRLTDDIDFDFPYKSDEEILDLLEEEYGYLGAPRNKKRVYRSITEPFEPSW